MPRITTGATVAEHRAQTWTALLDAVDEAIMSRGFSAVSLGDIAARAGVARTAFYNYFPDKAALLLAAADRATESARRQANEIANRRDLSARERINRFVYLLLDISTWSASHLYLAHALQSTVSEARKREVTTPARATIEKLIETIIDDGVKSGELTRPANLRFMVDFATGVIDAALFRMLAEPDAAAIIRDEAVTFIGNAIFPAPA